MNDRNNNPQLFRSEVVISQGSPRMGSIRLSQTSSGHFFAGLSILIIVSVAAFIFFGSVTRKIKVAGILLPSTGLVTIDAPSSGIIVKTFVKEGQAVSAQQRLFELLSARQGSSGELSALIVQQLRDRLASLSSERNARITEAKENEHALLSRITTSEQEIDQIIREVSILRRRVELAQNTADRYGTLQQNGFLSEVAAQEKQVDLLELEGRLLALTRNQAKLSAENIALQAQRNQIKTTLAAVLAQIRRQESMTLQEIAEAEDRNVQYVLSPTSGKITTINFNSGQAIQVGKPLATIIPARPGNKILPPVLEAHLFAPSKTTGFVTRGARVNIRFDAYAHQKFGNYVGHIDNISSTPIAPSELPPNIASTVLNNRSNTPNSTGQQSLYRIRVILDSQSIDIYGEQRPLQNGMTIEADLLQEKRRIWEWILQPILAVSRRT